MKEKILLSYTHGITNSPSDTLCGDGELAECVNLELKNQELVPMEMPVKLGFTLDSGEKLVLVHNIKTGGKNYFTLSSSGVLKAFKVVGGSKVSLGLSVSCGVITSIQSIGNTVVVYTPDSPHYILYKDGGYVYLGSSMPEMKLSFNLNGKVVVSEIFDVDVPAKSDGDDKTADNPDLSSDENKEAVTSQIIPQVNKFIAEESEAKGKFIYPFFARYAYKLFDGSYCMQSAPVLMMPSTTLAPLCGYLARQDKRPPFKTFIAAAPSTLSVRRNGTYNLGDWSDIISEVCVFVSDSVRTYDQEGEIESWSYSGGYSTPTHKSSFYGVLNSGECKKYGLNDAIRDAYYESGSKVSDHNVWDLPVKESGDITKAISECSLFYKYASFSPDFIDSNSYFEINPEETGINPVANIQVGERLPDDYMTHDILLPQNSLVYNSRLNISNIKRKIFKGFSAASLSQVGINDSVSGLYYIYTYIRTKNGDKIVKSPSDLMTFNMYGIYLFYPDTDAYRMIIHDTYNSRYADVPLNAHPTLNGAYYLSNFEDLTFVYGTPSVSESTDAYEDLPNKLFTSELNNPFYFPLEGIYTVGSGEIIGMTAVTRPISQGQFGEYPMMMFCSDGNYAMKVDAEGFYERISPIQEDIVLGNDKITPMEDSVVVITKKGLMLNQGGEMVKMAPQMDGGMFDKSILEGLSTKNEGIASLCNFSSDAEGFLSYLYGARMAFDYSSNRLFIYNTGKTYSYVYNFENSTVSKMILEGGAKVVSSVIDYPDTIIQDENGSLYSLYAKDDVSVMYNHLNGFALTRPMKFGGAMTMKSIYQIKNLDSAMCEGSFVKYSIYGSNDNIHYYKVASRFGKPYKYYRLAIYTNLLPKESFSGTAITIEERRTGKLR